MANIQNLDIFFTRFIQKKITISLRMCNFFCNRATYVMLEACVFYLCKILFTYVVYVYF